MVNKVRADIVLVLTPYDKAGDGGGGGVMNTSKVNNVHRGQSFCYLYIHVSRSVSDVSHVQGSQTRQ